MFVEWTTNGTTVKPGDMMDGEMVRTNYNTLLLKGDGTAEFAVSLGDATDVQTGTWTETNESFVVTIAGSSMEFVKDGNKLICEMGANKVILQK